MRSNRHPRVEALLQRVLLSVSVVKETLTIEGTPGKDDISLSVHPNVINLMSVKVNGEEKVFLLGRFKVININSLSGNDYVRINELYEGHPAYLNIDLGAGNDRGYGSAHNEKFIGANGNDRIAAGAGDDYVDAGNGDDVLVGDAGNDTLHGMSGKDTIYGGLGNDQIRGGNDADSIDGGDGNDVIDAGAGNDRIIELERETGGLNYYDKANVITGGSGDDYIQITPAGGASTVFGGDGKDYLYAVKQDSFAGSVRMNGDAGDDKIISPFANGGAGNDTIAADASTGWIEANGGEGEDRITVNGNASASVNGDAGNDFIEIKGAYPVTVHGGDGNDTINSYVDADTITGGKGNDLITANGRADGGEGDDLLRSGIGILKNASYYLGADFKGGPGKDLLIGGAYPDTLKGGDGDDILQGGDLNDSLEGGNGDDALFGGNGVDTLHGNDGNDSLFAGGMNDTRRNDDGKDFAYGEKGEDYFDKKSEWAETDKSNNDSRNFLSGSSGSLVSGGTLTLNSSGSVSYGVTISNGSYYGSSATLTITGSVSYNDLLGLAQNYGSIINPATPASPSTTTEDEAISTYQNAAIFSGMFTTSSPASENQIPDLLAAERKAIRGQFVHVPSDWTLTRVGKKSGLVWYAVTLADASRAKVFGELKGNPVASTSTEYDNTTGTYIQVSRQVRADLGTRNLMVSVMGVHPTSALLFDVAAGLNSYALWTAPASFASTRSMVTRAGTSGLLTERGETFSIGKPSIDLLDGVSLAANQRYLYTAQGLRTIDANGIGAIVS